MEVKPIQNLPRRILSKAIRRTYFVLTVSLNPDNTRLYSLYIEKINQKRRFKDFDYIYLLDKSQIKYQITKTIIRQYARNQHMLYRYNLYPFLIGIYTYKKQSYLLIKNLNNAL